LPGLEPLIIEPVLVGNYPGGLESKCSKAVLLGEVLPENPETKLLKQQGG
jgi:hypothetical protein